MKKDVESDDKIQDQPKIDIKTLIGKRQDTNEKIKAKKNVLKTKLRFMVKLLNMQKLLREERENIIKIKNMNHNKLPQGILLEGKQALQGFVKAK